MSPARKYAQLPRVGRSEVARLVLEEKLTPTRAIDLMFDVCMKAHSPLVYRGDKKHYGEVKNV